MSSSLEEYIGKKTGTTVEVRPSHFLVYGPGSVQPPLWSSATARANLRVWDPSPETALEKHLPMTLTVMSMLIIKDIIIIDY
jgi:hypothetical protein